MLRICSEWLEEQDVGSLRRALRMAGHEYDVYSAGNGDEALKLMQNTAIDIVLTDILMPEKDGLEVITAVRQKHPDVKIVAMSGGWPRGGPFDLLTVADTLGAASALKKPFTPEELFAALSVASDG